MSALVEKPDVCLFCGAPRVVDEEPRWRTILVMLDSDRHFVHGRVSVCFACRNRFTIADIYAEIAGIEGRAEMWAYERKLRF